MTSVAGVCQAQQIPSPEYGYFPTEVGWDTHKVA